MSTPGQDFSELPAQSAMASDVAVVWPMTLARWRFRRNGTFPADVEPSVSVASIASRASPRVHEAPAVPEADLDCWTNMGGRPEAWYLVCCDLNWSGCWGGDFTPQMCCTQVPGRHGLVARPSAEPMLLQRFLNFSDDEFALFLQALAPNNSQQQARGRFRCLTPKDCAKEAFARFYQASWDAGILPLRHPWFVDKEDHLVGVIWKMRAENRGGNPAGHEHTFERLQMGQFLKHVSETVSPEEIPAENGRKRLRSQHGRR